MTEKIVRLEYGRSTKNFYVFHDVARELADFNKYSVPKPHPFAEDEEPIIMMKESYFLKLKEGQKG